jgi:polar amino acid transport system substrate-binding protein
MTPKSETTPNGRRFNTITIVVSAVALALSSVALVRQSSRAPIVETEHQPGLLQRIEQSGEIHAGYGVYPPYTQEDPNTKKVTGFSVDIIEQIAAELKCKVIWHRLNWNTMSADLKRGEFDVIADPIFQTIPRAREFEFTAPYAYFADGIAVVRKDESRFPNFASLDREDIVIAVGQGWASETLVKSRFTKPKIVSVQTTTDLLQVFNDVVAGRADVAIGDGADAQRFVKEHPDAVKALWLDDPPAAMPAGFALRPDDTRGAEFLTVCLRSLESTGVLEGLANRWHVEIGKPKH